MYSEGLWELPTPRNLTLDPLGVNTPSLLGMSFPFLLLYSTNLCYTDAGC